MIESPLTPPDEAATPQPTTVALRAIPRRYGALAGLIAGAVAVTSGMLVAGIVKVASPIDAVGSEFIDRVPPSLKELAIQWFGTNDKLALRVGIVVTLAVAAAIVGYLAARRPMAGTIGIGVFGIVGALAALHRPSESVAAVLPAIIGTAIGIPLLAWLLRSTKPSGIERPGPSRVPLGWDRRRFLVSTGSAAGAAIVAGGLAQVLERRRVESIRAAIPDALPPVGTSGSADRDSGRRFAQSGDSIHHAQQRLLSD